MRVRYDSHLRNLMEAQMNKQVYACTVGLRPSHAGYYLSEMAELRQLLKALQVRPSLLVFYSRP